jgi:hypothetical protein
MDSAGRRVAHPLQCLAELRRLDRPPLEHPARRAGELDPAAAHSRHEPVQLGVRVAGVLGQPRESARRVEGNAEAAATAGRVDRLYVRADLAGDRRAGGGERALDRCRAFGVQAQHHAAQGRVVGCRTAEGVVDERRDHEWAVGAVLHPAAPALITDEDVELAVGPGADRAAAAFAVRVHGVHAGLLGHPHVVGLQ